METQKNKNHSNLKFSYALSLASQLGFLIISSIVGFLALGYYLDLKLGTAPIFLLIGIIVGVIVTIFEAYHLMQPLLTDDNHKSHDTD